MNLLNKRHEVLAIRLWDPRETELPDAGPIIMEDAETGEQLYVDTSDRKFRKRFQKAANKREAELNLAFKRAGVDALALSTEDDLIKTISALPNTSGTSKVKNGFNMTFIWPVLLYSLILIPLFIALYLVLQRRRKRIAANYQTLSTSSEIAKRDPGIRRHIPPILFLLSLAILGVALARPQTEVSLPHIEGTVILAFDVSGSMAADDFKANSHGSRQSSREKFR